MSIHQAIHSIRRECAPEQVEAELLSLLEGDRCTSAEDRCVALIALCDALLQRIQRLEDSLK